MANGAAIHFGKLYFLIAGYNTLSKMEKDKVDIQGIGKLFWFVMLAIGLIISGIDALSMVVEMGVFKEYLTWSTIGVGMAFLLLKSNSTKYTNS